MQALAEVLFDPKLPTYLKYLQPLSLTMGHNMLVEKCRSSVSLTDLSMSPFLETDCTLITEGTFHP